jgi:hypothetical protein
MGMLRPPVTVVWLHTGMQLHKWMCSIATAAWWTAQWMGGVEEVDKNAEMAEGGSTT